MTPRLRNALRVLNISAARFTRLRRPARRWQAIVPRHPDRCPVCGRADCTLDWSEEAHAKVEKTSES